MIDENILEANLKRGVKKSLVIKLSVFYKMRIFYCFQDIFSV